LRRCCAIGDGANDLPMLSAAGLGIAYRAKPVLRDATACRIDHTGLDSALHFMGIDAS
jgi:phosphoserine phosphatase